jgi:hypothetical protein
MAKANDEGIEARPPTMTFPIEKKQTRKFDTPATQATTNRLLAVDVVPVLDSVERIRSRYEALAPVMDERMARLWAAAEAKALGRGGTAAVAKATGILGKRILAGKRDLVEVKQTPPPRPSEPRRIRRPGGGRKALEKRDPELVGALEALVDPPTEGQVSPLRWTCKSTRQIAHELTAQGHPVGATKVRKVLLDLGYRLRGSRQGREAPHRPVRHAQFDQINRLAYAFHAEEQPVVWVEARRRELSFELAPSGRNTRANDGPHLAPAFPFAGDKSAKAVHASVHPVSLDEGWMSVGVDRDTAEFVAESLQQWWRRMGLGVYPNATELLVIADAAGRGETPGRFWKIELQRLADETGIAVHFCHCPPGTTKWHKIEHQLVCQMTECRRGCPIEIVERVVSLIAPTASAAARAGESRPDDSLDRDTLSTEWSYRLEPKEARRAPI